MDYTPSKDIIIGNPKLIAKKKQENALKVAITKTNTNDNISLSGKKISDDDELPKTDKVGIDTGKNIMQARLAKGLKQVDLAKQLNITPDVIRDYENGTAIRNNAVLSKIKRALNINTAKWFSMINRWSVFF